MKIEHRVPNISKPHGDDVSDEYQAEVDRHTAKMQRQYESAQARYASAEKRLERVKAERVGRSGEKAHARRMREATALAEVRRQELERLSALMTSVPASSRHRSREGHRPVPIVRGSLL